MPAIDALPKPAATAPDLAAIAARYQNLGRQLSLQDSQPELLVLVSLSMPQEALRRLAEQGEMAGATLVFRGLKGDSMMRMGEEIKAVTGNRPISVAIHPPAFQQFRVDRVPAVVIARREAGQVLDDGCSQSQTFVKVEGDVSLDYALEYIERKSPAWAAVAGQYRRRIVRGID